VESGQINFDVKHGTDIVTPTTRTKASANSTGNINVSEEGGTGVKIFAGSAQVATTGGQTVTLEVNQAVLVDSAGKAGVKIELPPPPALVNPVSQAELQYVQPPETSAQLKWAAVRGATTYHLAMDYNVIQSKLLLSAALDEPTVNGTTHALAGLDPGKYFWRVAGVSKEGLEGDFSRVSFFSVVKPTEPTPPQPSAAIPLVVQVADLEGVLEVRGRTDAGAVVSVDGLAIKVLPDGTFNEYLRSTGQPFIVVRATAADGKFTEEKRPVPTR
jgi:hypothetical protein